MAPRKGAGISRSERPRAGQKGIDMETKGDLTKAGTELHEAQEDVKLAHAAYQACAKAWGSIAGPSTGKREMWRAVVAARESFLATMQVEQKKFAAIASIVGQGDLFDGPTPKSEASTKPVGTA